MILEKGIIPPNALFEDMNPAIDADFYNIVVPKDCVPWPAPGQRRLSVNSFGFGGTNSHVILDDAYHYLLERGLEGNHCTSASPVTVHNGDGGTPRPAAKVNGAHVKGATLLVTDTNSIPDGGERQMNGFAPQLLAPDTHLSSNGHGDGSPERSSKLLVFSALDEKSLKRTLDQYQTFYTHQVQPFPGKIPRLAYTLAARRSRMLWRSFAIAEDASDSLSAAKSVRASAEVGMAFVFTGQGAQYVNMGAGLMQYPVYKQALEKVDAEYKRLGCAWSLFGKYPFLQAFSF